MENFMKVTVCNMRSSDFNAEFVESLINTGFAVITHHGVDLELVREVQTAWKIFFNKNRDYKTAFVNTKDSNLGFVGFGNEKAIGAQVPDIKEFFHWRPTEALPDEVRTSTEKLYYLLEQHIAGQLLQILDGVSANTKYAEMCKDSDRTLLRTLYYPALKDVKQIPGAVRASAHTDINLITLLVAASAPGLEVQDNNGAWHRVPFEDNCLIINAGDMLELASGGLFKSTTHRVVNPDDSNSDRISIPLFIHPKSDTLLAPGITAQQFLNERLNAIYSNGYKQT
jgi:isopenicillin N synthase-like dioxygenase